MHSLCCEDLETQFLAPLTPGMGVLSTNIHVDLHVVLHAEFQPWGSNGSAACSRQTCTLLCRDTEHNHLGLIRLKL